jgi:undecaprenyl-diphosphatase
LELFQAVVLGIVQGLTEFLPISSSGHLVIMQHLFSMTEPALDFDVCVHLGTLAAVCFFFRNDLAKIIRAVVGPVSVPGHDVADPQSRERIQNRRMAVMVVLGSIPTAVIGLLLNRVSKLLFSSVSMVGFMLIVTGTCLFITRFFSHGGQGPADAGRDAAGLTIVDALLIGTVQGLAVFPGLSRSGTTIAAGLLLGLNRKTAATYSFILSIPAVFGAVILVLMDLSEFSPIPPIAMAVGTVTAGLIGYAALRMLVYIVQQGRLYLFAPYCWVAGIVTIALG